MIKALNQIIVFILEIILLFTLGYYGLTRQWNLVPRLLFTIIIVAVSITLWAILAAPKSAHRLGMPYLPIFRAVMFLCAAFLLFQLEYKNIAIVIFALAIISQIISYFTEK